MRIRDRHPTDYNEHIQPGLKQGIPDCRNILSKNEEVNNAGFRTQLKRALTIQERIAFNANATRRPGGVVEEGFHRHWIQALSATRNGDAIKRRLAWQGVEAEADYVSLLGVPERFEADWVECTSAISAHVRQYFQTRQTGSPFFDRDQVCSGTAPLPFEDLFIPMLDYACSKLADRLQTGKMFSIRLCAEAQNDLVRELLVRLTGLAQFALYELLAARRPAGRNLALEIKGASAKPARRDIYTRLVWDIGQDGCSTLFGEFPVLARMLAVKTLQWIAAVDLMLRRMQLDWARLAALCGCSKENSNNLRVISIQAGLSDPHRAGQMVTALEMTDGNRVVYKPRTARLDAALTVFAERFCQGEAFSLRFPRCLSMADYCWVEYVQAMPVENEEDIGRFYFNAGALLFVVYLLGGTDCHRENIVAAGVDPVLIDAETLFQTEFTDETVQLDDSFAVFDSVLKTGLLPSWGFDRNGVHAADDSGLGSVSLGSSEYKPRSGRYWQAMNSDDMVFGEVSIPELPHDNEPRFKGRAINPAQYLDRIIEGFSSAWRRACRLRADGTFWEQQLPLFNSQDTRIIFRPTRVYDSLLKQCLAPDCLRSGLNWGLKLEQLQRPALLVSEQPFFWPVIQHEMRQMTQLDVPYLTAAIGQQYSDIAHVPVENSLLLARKRLEELNEHRLTLQCELIAAAFAARAGRNAVKTTAADWTDREPPELDTASSVAEARNIGHRLRERALEHHAVPQWLGFRYAPHVDCVQLDLVGQGLYDGVAGIALFLSAYEYVTGDDGFHDLWTRALKPLSGTVGSHDEARRFARMGPGIGSGLGGLLYATALIAHFAPPRHRRLKSQAKALGACLSPRYLEDYGQADVISGSAGAIFGLLAWHHLTGDDSFLAWAVNCARHVASCYPEQLSQPAAATPPLTGFSHGASGIALALARLGAATGDSDFDAIVELALDYEDGLYDRVVNNWPDLRNNDTDFMTSWCHGAPGIALARLELLRLGYRGKHDLETQCQQGIIATKHCGDSGIDHLCCGTLGLSEVLWVSAAHHGDQDLNRLARLHGRRVLADAVQNGRYRLFGGGDDRIFNPGFFQGVAGIGYYLLRLAYPEFLPSVLAFHVPGTRRQQVLPSDELSFDGKQSLSASC